MRREWRVLRPTGRWGRRISLRDLWSYRELALMLALRDLQLRYRQTLFGVGWAVLQPAVSVAVFTLVFGHLADVPSDGQPYAIFALAALVVWTFLSSAVGSASDTLVENRALVTDVWFPRILAPLAAVLAFTVDLAIGLLLLVPFFVWFGQVPPLQVLTLPVWLAGAVALAVGAALWLSAANVLYRDVRYVLPFLLQLGLFISPVVFPASLIEGGWRYVFSLNPAAGLIGGVRWALLDAPAPGSDLAVSGAALVAIVIGGAIYFQIAEQRFADRI